MRDRPAQTTQSLQHYEKDLVGAVYIKLLSFWEAFSRFKNGVFVADLSLGRHQNAILLSDPQEKLKFGKLGYECT